MTITVETLREEPSTVRGGKVLILQAGDNYYRASYIPNAPDTGRPETLVFPASEDGEVTEWSEVCGAPGMSMDAAVHELEIVLNGGTRSWEPDLADLITSAMVIFDPPPPSYYADEKEENA
jgi:hypothetical protein